MRHRRTNTKTLTKPKRAYPLEAKPKTAIYCRTALAESGKIAAQEARLRAYADEHGYKDIVCYADAGAAKTTLDRPTMNKLTEDIKAGKIGAVLAVNTSRIAPNLSARNEMARTDPRTDPRKWRNISHARIWRWERSN
ncbi:MAG: recombinase family protein [Deltaproteobacteria bacterium]|nr:recombinase family protein [Deltaproteobacteria bacterium]